jgi:hypothetical protein
MLRFRYCGPNFGGGGKDKLSIDSSCIDKSNENICSSNMKPFLQLLVLEYEKLEIYHFFRCVLRQLVWPFSHGGM